VKFSKEIMADQETNRIFGIVFDLGRCIIAPTASSYETLKIILHEHSLPSDVITDFVGRFQTKIQTIKEFQDFIGSGNEADSGYCEQASHSEVLLECIVEMKLENLDHTEIAEKLTDQIVEHTVIDPNASSVFRQLRDSGYKLAICSNTGWETKTQKVLRKFDVDQYFDIIVDSIGNGIRKPGGQIWQAILDKWGVSPGRVCHVGDRASRDILGANRVGMWSIYYKLSAKTRRGRNSLHNDQEYVSANDVCGPSHDLLPDIKLSNLYDLPETISNLKEKPLNQIQVGVYMRESKVKSLRKYDFWDLPHRNDIKFCFIDPDEEIRRDYDVILQKATTWFAEAEYFPDIKKQLERFTKFYEETKDRILFLDNPQNCLLLSDRVELNRRLEETGFPIPKTWFYVMKDPLPDDFEYPLVVKPRIALKNQCNGPRAHTLYFVSSPDGFKQIPKFDHEVIWVCQKFRETSHCHKIFVIGEHVFGTVNDTISKSISDSDEPLTQLDSHLLSKNVERRATPEEQKVYCKFAAMLRKKLGLSLFGFDLLIIDGENLIVDVNYFPSYKTLMHKQALFLRHIKESLTKFREDHNI